MNKNLDIKLDVEKKDYKFSRYNHFVEIEDGFLAFNSMSGALLKINKNLYNLLKDDDDTKIEIIKKANTKLFDNLYRQRFIIDANVDELSILKLRYNRDVFISNFYSLIINPTMKCNFNCWYCYESHVKGRMTEEMQGRVLKHLQNRIERNEISRIELGFFGGEPLLYFDNIVYPLSMKIKELAEKELWKDKNAFLPFSNAITTNGYLISEKRISKFKEIDLKFFQITLDGYREKHNKSRMLKNGQGTYDEIIKNIILLTENIDDVYITLRINYSNETLEDLQKIINDFPFFM